ncbi:MAG: ribonuclease HII [Rhodobiaceae bacterium]|nr:ribonuclease HII [Rhodobiaceae bacterium]RPF97195.1 MAG: ribonuclease HII [Rhizobiales bacterium TMED227]|tara:strand:- start:23569 stop:24189 length:621 start_codon:yes stop_codon:yes gene_type:complete
MLIEKKPSLDFENNYNSKGYKIIAGLDEAGRGPIAGPVVAAAVILDQKNIPAGIDDSKKLSDTQRKNLYFEIIKSSNVGIGVADVECIDSINILNATKYAMNLARMMLNKKPDMLLIDGNFTINNKIENVPIIGGDGKSLSIAAASIIAKYIRDEIMKKFEFIYPSFSFSKHRGYPTSLHISEIEEFGIIELHRKTFKPINKLKKK